MVITTCYCCGEDCKDWQDEGFSNCCKACAIEVIELKHPAGVDHGYDSTDSRIGDGFPDTYNGELAAVKANHHHSSSKTAPSKPVLGPPPVCKKCREVAPWAEPNLDFMCYSCRH